MNLKTMVKDVSLDYLKDTNIFNELERCLNELEKGQEILCALASGTEDSSLTLLKVGTLLSFSIVEKMWTSDNHPKDFNKEDWVEIAKKVADFGILADGQIYTEFIFTLYSDYIKLSVNVHEGVFSEDKKAEILCLSDQLFELNAQLEEGEIKESDYVDKCLWISYEAIIKLLSAYATCFMKPEYREFFQAIPDFALQYARSCMYSKEKALLEEYIDHQHALDAELEEKYKDYISELEERTEQFNNLIDKAFEPEFKDMLINSVDLAIEAGVKRNQVLDSLEKIDDYFS